MPTIVNHTYEAMFLFGIGVEAEANIALARGIIERHGGQVILIKRWDERRLAYEIGIQKRGIYVIAFFNAPSNAITGIERDVKLSENVLRVMVLRADHLNPEEMAAVEPQPIIPREERPSYDRPFGDRGGEGRGGDRGGEREGRGGEREGRGGDRGESRGPRGPRREESADSSGADKD